MSKKPQVVLGITGASGAIYAVRLLEVLVASGVDVHLSISPAGATLLNEELDLHVDIERFDPARLLPDPAQLSADSKLQLIRQLSGVSSSDSSIFGTPGQSPGEVIYHHYMDFYSPVASGSFLTRGMVICPCSGGTLASVAGGMAQNLITRAAEVHLKERRRLVLVTRETPLSLVHLENLHRCAQAGAVVLPACPGFYHGVRSVMDLVDFVVARICDQLGIPHQLIRRWGSQ